MQGFFIKRTPCAPLRICIVSFSVPYRWFSALISIRHLSFADFWAPLLLIEHHQKVDRISKPKEWWQSRKKIRVRNSFTGNDVIVFQRNLAPDDSSSLLQFWISPPPPLLSIEHRQWWLIWGGWKLHYLYNDRKIWIKANYLENEVENCFSSRILLKTLGRSLTH